VSETIPQTITTIMTVFSWITGIIMFLWAIHYRNLAKKYEPRAKQLMTMLGASGNATMTEKRVEKYQQSAKDKIIKNTPLKALETIGLEQKEIWALAQDEDFVKGFFKIVEVGGASLGKLGSLITGARNRDTREKGAQADQQPKGPYKFE